MQLIMLCKLSKFKKIRCKKSWTSNFKNWISAIHFYLAFCLALWVNFIDQFWFIPSLKTAVASRLCTKTPSFWQWSMPVKATEYYFQRRRMLLNPFHRRDNGPTCTGFRILGNLFTDDYAGYQQANCNNRSSNFKTRLFCDIFFFSAVGASIWAQQKMGFLRWRIVLVAGLTADEEIISSVKWCRICCRE